MISHLLAELISICVQWLACSKLLDFFWELSFVCTVVQAAVSEVIFAQKLLITLSRLVGLYHKMINDGESCQHFKGDILLGSGCCGQTYHSETASGR